MISPAMRAIWISPYAGASVGMSGRLKSGKAQAGNNWPSGSARTLPQVKPWRTCRCPCGQPSRRVWACIRRKARSRRRATTTSRARRCRYTSASRSPTSCWAKTVTTARRYSKPMVCAAGTRAMISPLSVSRAACMRSAMTCWKACSRPSKWPKKITRAW